MGGTSRKQVKCSKALLDDLARSGLDAADAIRMGLQDVKASAMKESFGKELPAYRIPYPAIFGREPFARYRYLASAQELKAENAGRYTQEGGSGNRLYFPPLPQGMRSWEDIAQDPSVPIIFVEGEKKAYAIVSRARRYAIGIGGVSSWAPAKVENVIVEDGGFKLKDEKQVKGRQRKPKQIRVPLKGFDRIDFKDRSAIINFDWPDVVVNPMVRREREQFAAFLAQRGAIARKIDLSDDPDSDKIAADDFIRDNGADAYNALVEQAPLLDSDGLSRMRSRFLKIIKPANTYFDREACELLRQHDFYGSTKHLTTFDEERKPQEAAQAFDRNPVWATRLVFRPGAAPLSFVADDPIDDASSAFNVWPGAPEARENEALLEPLIAVFEHLRKYNNREVVDFFERWSAWPIARPAECKMKSAVVLYSREQGTGKTLLGEILGKAYHPSCVWMMVAGDLHGSFNYWARHRQFIVANEATPSRSDAERLKSTITESEITINLKNAPIYVIENRFNLLFTTNHLDSLRIDETDRRFAILHFPNPGEELLKALIALSKDPRTPSALVWHQQNKVNLSKFDLGMRAPESEIKNVFIDSVKDEPRMFAEAVRDNPHEALGAFYEKALTTRELLCAYDVRISPRIRSAGEPLRVKNALRHCGFKEVGYPPDKGGPYSRKIYLWAIDKAFCDGMTMRKLHSWYCKQRGLRDPKLKQALALVQGNQRKQEDQ